jgi:hypothetical protein
MTFCWYGPYTDGSDEVDAWGQRWVPKESSETTIEASTAIRCLKNLKICIQSSSHTIGGKTRVNVEVLPVTRWDSQQVMADGESVVWEPCERDSFIINRVDRSVLMVSSPGPEANSKGCTGVLGKARTVVYTLSQ